MSDGYRVRELLVDNEVLAALLRGVRTLVELDLPPDAHILRIYQRQEDQWAQQFRVQLHSVHWPEVRPDAVDTVALVAN